MLIDAQNLYKSFGDTPAVIDVSLAVEPGEIYGLVGPDGAGKTTTIRLLVGAMQADDGEVWVNGISIADEPDRAREGLGYLSQRFSLYEDLTVWENLRFFAEVRQLPAGEWRQRSLDMLEFVGLSDFLERRAGNLSGGMKQKLGLASALVHQPQVLLLDEPTGGVDPVTRQDFWQLIIRLTKEEGIAVVVSTPYMDEAIRCARVGFLREGRMVVEGRPEELLSTLRGRVLEVRSPRVRTLRGKALAQPHVEDVQAFGDRLHLRLTKADDGSIVEELETSLRNVTDGDVQVRAVEPQLEDVFMALVESEA